MAWKKSPPELVSAFDRLVPATRAVERRTMFGYPAAFVGGNMFAGLHEDRFVLRLGDEDLADAKRLGAKDFEPMPGRAMKGWIILPERLLADDGQACRWIERARSHVSTMPAKGKKKGATKR
ncbi:MAG: TfoX/Sxy family protein [Deltaproteobacteria bacterium]|nr:MAG: TfoX/Sxy family protein [Deltaproteobacteria bacterium]